MKLLQLNVTANWGSTGRIAEGIGRAVLKRGWNSYIAYGRMMNSSESQLMKVGRYADNVKHFFRDRLLDGEGLGSRRPTEKLIAAIREIDPDIVQLHNIHDHWLNYPLLFDYLNSSRAKVCWTLHDCWAFTGHCYHFEHIGCEKWTLGGCRECPQKKLIDNSARNFELKRKLVGRLIDRFTVVSASEWISGKARTSLILGSAGHRTIHNGIDLRLFRPSSVKKDKLILGVSNVWNESKGLGDFSKLRLMLPSDYRILIVGLTEKQISALPDGIEGKPRIQSIEELADCYSSALALVNPTYSDTFPTVNIEALACGTPVVTYRTGGSPEAVDENTGIVVEQGDVAGLCDAISTIAFSTDRFTPALCRARAETCFDCDEQFGRYVDLYESLIYEK